MEFEKYEDEISKYVDVLYAELEAEIVECLIPKQVDAVFENEKIRVQDFMKYLERSIKIELVKNGDTSLASLEVVKEDKYYIPERNIESSKVFNKLEIKSEGEKEPEHIEKKEKKENFNKRSRMLIACVVITFIIGYIIRKSIIDATMTAAVGVLVGVGANEILYADKRSSFENLLQYQRVAMKKIDDEYLEKSLIIRKKQIETALVNFLNHYKKRITKS